MVQLSSCLYKVHIFFTVNDASVFILVNDTVLFLSVVTGVFVTMNNIDVFVSVYCTNGLLTVNDSASSCLLIIWLYMYL